jgi:hypothetical protein
MNSQENEECLAVFYNRVLSVMLPVMIVSIL